MVRGYFFALSKRLRLRPLNPLSTALTLSDRLIEPFQQEKLLRRQPLLNFVLYLPWNAKTRLRDTTNDASERICVGGALPKTTPLPPGRVACPCLARGLQSCLD